MKAAGLRGISRVKTPRTTVRATTPDTRPDLVQRDFTASIVLARRTHVAARALARIDENLVAFDASVFLHDDRVGADRQRRAGRDAHAFVGFDLQWCARACEHRAAQTKAFGSIREKIGSAQGETVHGGIGERRDRVRSDDVGREDAIECALDRHIFRRQGPPRAKLDDALPSGVDGKMRRKISRAIAGHRRMRQNRRVY